MKQKIWFGLICLITVLFSTSSNAAQKTVVFLGDSLVAGYGVDPSESYPSVIQQKIKKDRLNWMVVNAGVSGDTTQGGKNRLKWVLKRQPDMIVVALGANDGMRGIPTAVIRDNLNAIIDTSRKSGVFVVLMGIRIPTNYGKTYEDAIVDTLASVAKEKKVPYLPFYIRDVAAKPELNLADGIHPNPAGHQKVADRVYSFLIPHLRRTP
ncbi:arylesterase [bacterium]|nr:arylesterase [bacterium]